ncbi:transporter [Amycolatopsis sp. NPDC059657]|uniref:transporter n=1 Tax=Amycolatopsis sp. NPDC059657 TaxID=3346899 RepID=UPI00366FF76D
MIWLTWRQFRSQAAVLYALAFAIIIALACTGPRLAGLDPNALLGRITSADSTLYSGGIAAMYALPALIGIFCGVPLVAREAEAGTHALVWNQTVTRTRWLAVKLTVTGLAAVAAMGLLSLAVTWWSAPIDRLADLGTTSYDPRMSPLVFAARGIVPLGYTAFAFVAGVTAGVLLRRTVAAMAVTLAVLALVQLAIPLLVRPSLLPSVQETVAITSSTIEGVRANDAGVPEKVTTAAPADAWVLSNDTVDASGQVVSLLPESVWHCMPPPPSGGRPAAVLDLPAIHACFAQLGDLGYKQVVAYQPATRFWALQGAETALYLVLSALLTWLCFRSARRVH